MKKFLLTLVLIFMSFVLVGFSLSAQTEFSRQAMLENIGVHIILPLQQDFLNQTTQLQTTTEEFITNPSSDTLLTLQNSWRATSYRWEQIALFEVGRLPLVLHRQVENIPINADFIENLIAGSDPIDEAFVERFGTAMHGLPVIEYFIFDGTDDNTIILESFTNGENAQRRLDYLQATVNLLSRTANELWDYWSPEGQDYLSIFTSSDDASDVQGSISMFANRMMGGLEDVIRMSLGWPLGTVAGEIRPDIVEARLSQYSLEQIRSFFEILQVTFHGEGETGNQLGFDDYLNFLGATINDQPLASAISEQIDMIFTAIDAIDEPLHLALVNNPEAVQKIFDEAQTLLVLIKVDMAAQVGITITYNDSDGD